MSLLLFPGIPGGPELFVILVIFPLLLIVPAALVAGAYLYGKRRGHEESGDGEGGERVE
jgi:hypothetical protein